MTSLLNVDHDVFIMIIDKVYKRRKELNDILFNTIVANYRFVHRFNWKRYSYRGEFREWTHYFNQHCFLHTYAGHHNKSPLIKNNLSRDTLIKTMDENEVEYKNRWNRKEMCAALMKHGAVCYKN